ncbi:MAG: hypothetical protein PVH00_13240 [Gemmatimonadota bacterium]
MVPHRWVVPLCVAALAGCAEPQATWDGRILHAGGVLRVENPREPLAAPGEVTAEPLWSQSGPESGDVWEVPNRVHAFRGVVYVVDRRASRVHRVTTGGAPLPSLGEPGSGPGQYRRIQDAVPTEAGLFVIDPGNGRVEVLSDVGEVRTSMALRRLAFTVAPLGTDAVALAGASGPEPEWTRLDAAGSSRALVFPDFDVPVNSEGPVSSGSTWNDRLVRLRYATPEVRIWSGEGVLEREIVIPLPVEPVTDDEIERVIRDETSSLMTQGLPAGVLEQVAASIRAWPREKKRFRKIVFDDAAGLAAIWEQNPEDFGSGTATLHLLTLDGVYLAALPFDRAWSDFDLEGDVLFCLSRDPETDVVTLQAHALEVPRRLLDHARAIMEQGAADGSGKQ